MTSHVWQYPELWDGCIVAWCPSRQRFPSTTLIDYSAANNHGTLTNMDAGSDWVVSDGKMALEFDGTNDYVTTPLTWQPTRFCISWWTNPALVTDYNQQVIGGTWGQFVFHTETGGGVYVGTDITNRFTPSDLPGGTVAVGQWQHFAYVLNNGAASFCKNGKVLASKSNDLPSAWSYFQVGHSTTNTINGRIDDVRIYGRNVTPNEIRTLAMRRGIAYETKRRRSYKAGGGGGPSRPDLGLLLGVS